MSQRIDAIFENGVFRPEVPVSIPNGERVSMEVESKSAPMGDLSDVADLLDTEYIEMCRRNSGPVPSFEEVRQILSKIEGSLADMICEERDER
jgi:predicted DNA-binding antitoxin AbrB/MazE fold protein